MKLMKSLRILKWISSISQHLTILISSIFVRPLAAGKHVLYEKSITLNSEELTEAIKLAEENHVKLAEAMTIFHMPIYRKLSEIVASGKLGPLKVIQMNFGSYKGIRHDQPLFNRNLAGGAILDIGVYALSFVRWFMTLTADRNGFTG